MAGSDAKILLRPVFARATVLFIPVSLYGSNLRMVSDEGLCIQSIWPHTVV